MATMVGEPVDESTARPEVASSNLPEDVNWTDRWVELENETVAVQAMKEKLNVEILRLRSLQVDAALPASASLEVAAPPATSAEVQELQDMLADARKQCERLLEEQAAERCSRAKLSEELERQKAGVSQLSMEKFQYLHEKNITASKLLPAQQALAHVQREKEEAERLSDELRAKLKEVTAECSKLVREKSALQRDFTLQVEALQADVALQRRIAEDSREAMRAVQKQAVATQQRLNEKVRTLAEERAELQEQLGARGEELARVAEQRERAQQQLADALRDRDGAVESSRSAVSEAEELREKVATFQAKLAALESEHEELLRQRLPGFDGSALPEGSSSAVELVRDLAAARQEAREERQAKERAQEVLRGVEREVRARFPALLARGDEVERLHRMAEELVQENEGLLDRLERLRASKLEVEKQQRKAEFTSHVLEKHMHALSKQLAVLVHENHKLGGQTPTRPPNSSEIQALEADRSFFRSVEQLARQNVALRIAVARSTPDFQTSPQQPTEPEKEPSSAEVGQQRQEHTQDHVQDAQSPTAPPAQGTAEATTQPPVESHALALADLAAVREEFTRRMEVQRAEVSALQESELRLRQELSTTQKQLSHEKECQASLEEKLRQAEASLSEREAELRAALDKTAGLESEGGKGAAAPRQEPPAPGQALHDDEHLQAQAELARQEAAALRQSNAQLVAEKASQAQLVADMQAQLERQAKSYQEVKQALEKSFESKESLWQQQLTNYKASVEELRSASALHKAEAANAEARAKELEATANTPRAQPEGPARGAQEPQAAGAAGPAAAAAGGAGLPSGTDASQTCKEADRLKVGKLQEQLRHTEEKMHVQAQNVQLWESLARGHEADLKARREEIQDLQQKLAAALKRGAEVEEEAERARDREQLLQAQVQELTSDVARLHAALGEMDEKVKAAQQEGNEEVREAMERIAAIEQESSSSRDVAARWQQSFQEEAAAHAEDIRELAEARGRCSALEHDLEDLRQQCRDLAAKREQAQAEREEEIKDLRWRLQRTEVHVKGLMAESSRYEEHLLALSEQHERRDGASEAFLQIASEMRRAGDVGERRRCELELSLAAREREAAALRGEVAALQQRLDGEQRELARQQEQLRRREHEGATLCQLQHVMSERRQQAAKIVALEARERELCEDLAAQKEKVAPLEERVRALLQQEEAAAGARRRLEAQADEQKRLYDEVVVKLDTHDVNEFKRLREESTRWQAQRNDLHARLEKELRQRSQDALSGRALKERTEELQRHLGEEKSRAEQLARAKAQLHESNQKKEAQCKQLESLKTLRDKKIEELERDLKRSHEERQRWQATAERVPAQHAAALGKSEEETKLAQQRADRGLAVAMDYQRALEALLAHNRDLEGREEQRAEVMTSADRGLGRLTAWLGGAEEHERAPGEAKAALDRELREDRAPEPQASKVNKREETSLTGSAGTGAGDHTINSGTASTVASAEPLRPAAAQAQFQVAAAASSGADGAAGIKRKASSSEVVSGVGAVASVSAAGVCSPSTTVGAAEGGPAKAARGAPSEGGAGGAVAAASPGPPAREMEGAGGAQSGRRVLTAVKAGALAVQATSLGTLAAASSSGAGTSSGGSASGLGTRAAAAAATAARGVGMVVDLEEEPEGVTR